MKERLTRVLAHMERFRLTRLDPGPFNLEEDWRLDDEDVVGTLVEHRPPPLLFGKFSGERVLAEMQRWGITARVHSLGYRDLRPEFSGQDVFETRFCVLATHPDVDHPCRLMDIRTHQGELATECPFDQSEIRLRALILDWISLEDEARDFAPGKLTLPGQKHPGLGIFRRSYRMTLGFLRQTDFDVVVNIPEYFHNAVLYSRDFRFFMGHREGRFLAMRRDLLPTGLARASRALIGANGNDEPRERVQIVGTDHLVRWTPAEQVLPLCARLRDYFYDSRYRSAVQSELDGTHYRLVDPRDAAHSAPIEEPL